MDTSKFKAVIRSTAAEKHCNISTVTPRLVDGFWSSDNAGKSPITSAKLGETVYFHVEAKDFPDGSQIILKLREYDMDLMDDMNNPDDKVFSGKEVQRECSLIDNSGTVELVLPFSWEQMIAEDTFRIMPLDSTIELYWRVTSTKFEIETTLPKRNSPFLPTNYLRVGYCKMAVRPDYRTGNAPQFFAYDGSPMVFMEYTENFIGDIVKDKSSKHLKTRTKKAIRRIALGKLKNGYLVDSANKVSINGNARTFKKELYTNSGELVDVELRKVFGYDHGDGLVTAKGTSQLDYFSTHGKRVKVLNAISIGSSVFDIFDLTKFATQDLDTEEPLPLQLGPLAPISDLAGALVKIQKAEWDSMLEEEIQGEMDEAKSKGLEAVRKVKDKWNIKLPSSWGLRAIHAETANKLLKGEFEEFPDLVDFDDNYRARENGADDQNIHILYLEIPKYHDHHFYIIEAIFIEP